MARRLTNVDEMFDILSSMNAGKFATICYVNVASLLRTKRSIDMEKFGQDLENNRREGDSFWYDPLKKFHSDDSVKKNPIYAIISVTRYNLNWSTEESYNKNFKKYMDAKNAIDKRWEIYKEPEDRKPGGFSKVNSMGISVGNTDNTVNRAYIHQNTYNAKKITTYYVVNEDGKIQGEIPYEAIRSILSKKTKSGINALKKLNKSDEEIKQYLDEIDSLKFNIGTFLVDKILYIVATVNGEKIFFINDRLPSEIANINVDSQSFIDMVRELFNKSYKDITEACIKFKNKLMESRIRIAVRDSIRKLLF